jgi:TolB-like protein
MKYRLLVALIPLISCIAVAFVNATNARAELPITVVVSPFSQASAKENYSPLAEAIGDMVMVRLSAVEGLVIVDRAVIDKVLKEQELSLLTSSADRMRLGRIVGAKFVLTGSVTAIGDEFQVNAHLLDVSTSRIARSAKVTARSDRLMGPIDKVIQELVGELKLKLPELTDEQIDKSPEANLHFMRGLGYYFAKMPDDAVVEFMKVMAIDPFHARARFWNGMAYYDQSEYDHAKLEFARFLNKFGQNPLAPRAKELLEQCEIKSSRLRQGESP